MSRLLPPPLRRLVSTRTFVSSAEGLAAAKQWPTQQVCREVQLTHSEIAFYRDNGYVIIRNFLNPQQLQLWRSVIDKAVEERGQRRFHYGTQDHTNENEDFYSKVFQQRVNLWKTSPEAAQLLKAAAPVVGRVAANLEGVPAVRVWHDQALYKLPLSNATSWHTDMPYWSFTSPHALSQWIALDDATLKNGCMWFHPKTHRAVEQDAKTNGGFKEIKIGTNMNGQYDAMPFLYKVGTETVAAEMRAGDCSFHSGMLVHGAGPNMTLAPRRAMTVQFMPVGCKFNGKRNVLTEEEFQALKLGDSMDDDNRNPLVA